MHRSVLIVVLLSSLMYGLTARAADGTQQAQRLLGKRVYDTWCVECHGPGPGRDGLGLTGTAALQAKYAGKVPAVLDERTDLTPDIVRFFVRSGVSLMPFFRKTEISDDELAALGTYLSRPNAPAGRPGGR